MRDPDQSAGAFVVLSSYEKGRLIGPVWGRTPPGIPAPAPGAKPGKTAAQFTAQRSRMRRLVTDLPQTLLPLGAVLHDPQMTDETPIGLAQLSLALKYIAMPLSWTAGAPGTVHRPIPSPRSLFSSEIFMVNRPGSGGVEVSRLLPDDAALTATEGGRSNPDIVGDAGFAFVIVGNHDRIIDPYGQFSPILVGLEAGFLSGQIQLICRALGWRCEVSVVFDVEQVSECLALKGWWATPLAIVRVFRPLAQEVMRDDAWSAGTYAQRVWPQHHFAFYKGLESLVRSFQLATKTERARVRGRLSRQSASSPNRDAPAASPAAWDQDLLAVVRARSAGRMGAGGMPLQVEKTHGASLADLCITATRLLAARPANEIKDVPLSLYVYVINGDQNLTGLSQIDLADGTLRLRSAGLDIARLQSSFAAYVHVCEFSFIFTVTVNFEGCAAIYGAKAVEAALQAAGEMGTALSIAASAWGYFARPVRAYKEGAQEGDFPIREEILLQVLCGKDRQAGPRYMVG